MVRFEGRPVTETVSEESEVVDPAKAEKRAELVKQLTQAQDVVKIKKEELIGAQKEMWGISVRIQELDGK